MSGQFLDPTVYEILTHGTTQDIPFYQQLYKQRNGPILDLGAGLGRLSLPLLHAGANVVLMDHNPQMCSVLADRLSHFPAGLQERAWVVKQDVTMPFSLSNTALLFGNQQTLPEQFELIIIGLRTLHLFDEPTRQTILSTARTLLSSTGSLVIHHSDLPSAPENRGWTLVAEHPIEGGLLEIEECFFYHSATDQFHLRHRIWQSNDTGQHVGTWRVAHNLFPIDIPLLKAQLRDIGFTHTTEQSMYATESFVIATL